MHARGQERTVVECADAAQFLHFNMFVYARAQIYTDTCTNKNVYTQSRVVHACNWPS